MNVARRATSVSDRTLNRLIRGTIMVLAVAVPLAVAIHFLDRGTDHGPTLIERQIEEATAVVRKTPDQIGPRLTLARLYQAANKPGDARQQYDEILKAEPTNKSALVLRAGILLDKGDLDGAQKDYASVVKLASGGEFAPVDRLLGQAYYGLGETALKRSDPKAAASAFSKAVKIDRTDADAWYQLGIASLDAGQPKAAVEAFKRAVLFVPTGWPEPYAGLSESYAKLGQDAYAEYARAMADFSRDRVDAAQARLEPLASGPARVDAMLGLGMIAETKADRPAALRWYRQVLAADRDNFNAQAGLSRLGAGAPPSHDATSQSGGTTSNGTS